MPEAEQMKCEHCCDRDAEHLDEQGFAICKECKTTSLQEQLSEIKEG